MSKRFRGAPLIARVAVPESRGTRRVGAVALMVLGSVLFTTATGHAYSEVELPLSTPAAIQISEDTLQAAIGSQADTQVEPFIAVDPNNPLIVVATFQEGRFPDGGSVDCGYATSHDGGQTWVSGDLPLLTVATGGPFARASDPAVAFGPDGKVYIVTLAFGGPRSAIAVQRSDDGGITFGAPVLAQDDNSSAIFNDKEWITVDTFPASPHYGRLYVVWDQSNSFGAPILLRYSDNRGATWSAVKTVSSASAGTVGAIPLVQPNGDLTIVYDDYSNVEREVAQTSHDGGVTFAAAVTIGTFNGGSLPDIRSGGLPAAAIDAGTGDLYAAWQDRRFRTDGLRDAVLSRSTNGGATWGALVRVNADATNGKLDHFTPAVAALNGVVHVTYRTRDVSAGLSPFVEMRDMVSLNRGVAFGNETVLGDPADLRFAAFVTGAYCTNPPCAFLGDYMGIAAAPGAFHPVWCRSFDEPASSAAQHQTAWSSSIPAPAAGTPTATATRTSSLPTATPTPTPFSISGRLTYYSNGDPVGDATVQLTGAVPGSTSSDATGRFTVGNLSAGNWQIVPQKVGDLRSGISTLDASYILQAIVNQRTLTADQSLACDVSGNGTISAFDASLILQFKVGLISRLPVADTCMSDWVFIPQPATVDHQVQTQPLMSTGNCQPGAIAYSHSAAP